MKRYFFPIILILCFIVNAQAQESAQKRNTPKEDIKVNREYDEQGNLIKFDSTYSYSWSGDTTLMKSFSPDDFRNLFGDHFSSFSDSAFVGRSFFDSFEQLFAQPFSSKSDSILMKKFGIRPPFSGIQPDVDSLAFSLKDFDSFFHDLGTDKRDSISHNLPGNVQPKSMDDIMKILQRQMKEMEEKHRKFFSEEPKLKEF